MMPIQDQSLAERPRRPAIKPDSNAHTANRRQRAAVPIMSTSTLGSCRSHSYYHAKHGGFLAFSIPRQFARRQRSETSGGVDAGVADAIVENCGIKGWAIGGPPLVKH